ncbi:MAG: phenylalanine--tRNA ligase subunit beta, partial [Patescibacteria group bacterium]|nr:phenylalanine--tRNA ligase subunit beta [Patescibacteria group bacterium]
KLTMHTVEVEKVEYQAEKFKNVIVGKILEVKPHPNADRLRLALVDINKEKLEIVCGAPNIKPGQFVPVALVGAILPNGMEIKPAEIRGIKSNGMLCAEDELGLGEGHEGIMILEKAKIGQSFSDYLKLNDVVFEVDNKSITHRADLWSHYGMARDISAFLNTKFKVYAPKPAILKAKKITFRFKAKVEDFSLCPRYMAVGLENIKIAPSPKWLQERLAAAGMRAINNIVDVTNYVMLELGQPLHAFDKNFIDHIIVRQAKSGEAIKTLDGVERKLEPDMLVIADITKPVAVAGVMGGANSEINNQTASIIIESANFNFDSVRKTAQKLGLRTEASMRFEKGLDPNLCELGLIRAVELILEICPGARVAGNLADEKRYKLNQGLIDLNLMWLNKFIGYEFTAKEVKRILEKLGFLVKAAGNGFKVTIPSWRAVHDVSLPEDLAEEVARIYGYNNLKSELPKIALTPPLVIPEKVLIRKIKNILSMGAGLSEVYNYSFLNANRLEKLKFGQTIKLANPLSEDLTDLRPSLIPGILENIKTNQASESEITIYEIGSVFFEKEGEIKKDDSGKENLPLQEKRLALALAGDAPDDLFRKLKGVIEFLLKSLNLEATFEFEATEYNKFASAKIMAEGNDIGRVAELEKNVRQNFGIKKLTAIAEISLPKLLNLVKNSPVKQYVEPPKYPAVSRDLAFVVNEKVLYNNIVKEIKNFNDLIRQVDLFDVYQAGKLGDGKKSLAFHIIYQADKTLTSEEVDEIQGGLVKHLKKKFEAKVRDF